MNARAWVVAKECPNIECGLLVYCAPSVECPHRTAEAATAGKPASAAR
jgi:hypothetical protein